MKRTTDIRKIGICNLYQEILIQNFITLTKQRVRNRIMEVHDDTGNLIIEDKCVKKLVVNYFGDLSSTTFPSDFDSFMAELTPCITFQMNQSLLRIVMEEEIRHALFMMHLQKTLGPDEMTAFF